MGSRAKQIIFLFTAKSHNEKNTLIILNVTYRKRAK